MSTVSNDDLMHNLLKQLSKQERIILADMWESDIRPVFEKLLGQRQLQLAQFVLKSSSDHYYTVEQRGRANECMNIARLLSENLKKVNNDRAAKNKTE
jgi:hypothetical protein